MCSTFASASSSTLLRVAPERVVRGVGDLARRRGELAQDRPLADDLRVVADVRGRRHVLRRARPGTRGRRRSRASAPTPAPRDSVTTSTGLPSLAERDDVPVDDAVRVAVEVVLGQHVADAVGRLVVEQQAAQDRLLRLERVRRQLQRRRVGDRRAWRSTGGNASILLRGATAARSARRETKAAPMPARPFAGSTTLSGCGVSPARCRRSR